MYIPNMYISIIIYIYTYHIYVYTYMYIPMLLQPTQVLGPHRTRTEMGINPMAMNMMMAGCWLNDG